MSSNLGKFIYKNLTVSYRIGTEDEKVLSHSFENDIFFKEIPSFKPSAHPIIIDVGSHIGTFALYSAIRYPQSTIYAIEASLNSYNILVQNIISNNLKNIIPIHAALTDVNGKIKLFHSAQTGNWGHSITKQFSDSYEEVAAITLNDLKEQYKIETIDLIKFNCEGAEFGILESFKDKVNIIKLALVLYHEDLVASNKKISTLETIFINHGFRTLLINRNEAKGRGWLICWNKNTYTSIYRFFSWIKRRLVRVTK